MKPMLACKDSFDIEDLRFPLLGSPKYDGIRGLVTEDQSLVSRKLKLIPNRHARALFERAELIGMEGELIAGPPTAPDCMQRTTSAVMSENHKDDELRFYVFDYFLAPDAPYTHRLTKLASTPLPTRVEIVDQVFLPRVKHAIALEEKYVKAGFEGMMLRDPDGTYKYGRSCLSDQKLLKWKRFKDSEAVILEVEEMMHNDNEATVDNLGKTKRSKAKAGMRPAGMLGRMKVRDLVTGVVFYVGAGPLLTLANRIRFWKERRLLPGMTITYRFQEVGVKDAPRFPRAIAFRDERDL